MNQNLERRRKFLATDYAENNQDGIEFQFFYCPILMRDEAAELCIGHVIPQALGGTRWTVQRRDVDSFYGRIVESQFKHLIEGHDATWMDMLKNESLSRCLNFQFMKNGVPVGFYKYQKGPIPPEYTPAKIEFSDNHGEIDMNVVFKMPHDSIDETCKLEFSAGADLAYAAIATLIKSAHLTMFSLLGYSYAFTAGGQFIAKLLRQFFLDNKTVQNDREIRENAKGYFWEYRKITFPITDQIGPIEAGDSIYDQRFIVVRNGRGGFFAIGIFVSVPTMKAVVFVPTGDSEDMATYCNCFFSPGEIELKGRLAEFGETDGVRGFTIYEQEEVCFRSQNSDYAS